MVYDDASMATVSVIIPSYNRATTLSEAINSVMAQDYHDFEIIVVDDGSTDNTPDILQAFPKMVVVRQDRQGVSAARNAGIAQASGRLVAFLDSDDLWLPAKLATQVAFFDSNPDALICQTEEIWIRNGMRVNPKKRHKKPSGMVFTRSLELCIVSPSAVMMRSSLFDEVGVFDESLPVCEDYDLWLRVACRFPIHLIDLPLVVKRGGHPDQLSRKVGVDRYRIQALKKIIESGLLSPAQYDAAVFALQEKCGIYAVGCEKRGRNAEAEVYKKLSRSFTRGNTKRTGVVE
jgi:glycosyltransferase involved in cell wall biosynthesis